MSRIRTLSASTLVALALVACGGEPTSSDAVDDVTGAAKDVVRAPAAAEAAAGETVAATAVAEDALTNSAPAAPDLAAGEATYGRFCFSCHAAGVAGAPKMGEVEDWAPRAAKGLDNLVASTIEGVPPGMPARGLCMNCSDDDLRSAVAWMLTQQ